MKNTMDPGSIDSDGDSLPSTGMEISDLIMVHEDNLTDSDNSSLSWDGISMSSEEIYMFGSESSYYSDGFVVDLFENTINPSRNYEMIEYYDSGLSNEEINRLCSAQYCKLIVKVVECGICMSKFSPSCVVTELTCAHIFHSTCVIQWLLRNNSCPICRAAIVDRNRIGR